MTYIFDKSIHLQLSADENLGKKGEILVKLLQEVFERIVEPYSLHLVIDYDIRKPRSRRLDFNAKNLQKIYDLLLKGEIIELHIRDYYEDPSKHKQFFKVDDPEDHERPKYVLPNFALGLNCRDVDPRFEADQQLGLHPYSVFSFSLTERLFNGVIPEKVQEQFITLFKKIAIGINATNGFISFGSSVGAPRGNTIFEMVYRISPDRHFKLTDFLRGYFWLNLLTSTHISKLGGLDTIKNTAPCSVVEEITIDRQPAVILQLTPDINNYNNSNLKQLRDFLVPVLPIPENPNKDGLKSFMREKSPQLVDRLVESID
ncbi:hypothetical protein [Paenibacillus wynnii]|uniref:hypothetical protein n=1 Tax=Paenibacillus wynnii TaxID=268407 RepID=UPI0027931CEF|nr:hypothetical protein [Paenibacillus wynnii]MDQ0192261.1 hypothetical protein [Paenibacillus wynnii]